MHADGPGSLYDLVGGEEWFVGLVDRFYDGVVDDPVLRPLYPDDLTESRAWLAAFLSQYWGGPPHYNAQRGHPRLRMRHAGFVIGPAERDAWLGHMGEAVRAGALPAAAEAQMLAYFDQAAAHLTNRQ